MANRWGKMEIVTDFISSSSKISVDGDCNHEIKRCLLLGRKAMTNLKRVLKGRGIIFPTKVCIVKAMVFPVVTWIWELVYKECWALKNLCFQTVVLDKTLESPLDRKEIKPVSPKGNQPWIFIGRTDAEAEATILWPPNVKSRPVGKDSDAGKSWCQEEKRATEDEMVGCPHWLNGHEFEQTLGEVKDRSLKCWLQSVGSQSDMT